MTEAKATTVVTSYTGAKIVAEAVPGSGQVTVRFVMVPSGRTIVDVTCDADTADEWARIIRDATAVARPAGEEEGA